VRAFVKRRKRSNLICWTSREQQRHKAAAFSRFFTGREDLAMTHRKLAYIVKDQKPLILSAHETVQNACKCMKERRAGSVLVVDKQSRLSGIFTGRDAVQTLAQGKDAAATMLADVMTPNPITISPNGLAIEALRKMNDGGFRHLPVVEENTICGVVSRNDFKGIEIDQLDDEEHLRECIW
jgi:CBS domain-containing protein